MSEQDRKWPRHPRIVWQSMVKARVNFNDFYYKHRVFGKEVLFVNIPKFPSYVHSRVTRIETKEPETLEWLDTIQAGDILYDIGANIGLYTVAGWAKARKVEHEKRKATHRDNWNKTRPTQVFAFEPHFTNYFCLNMNIEANGMQGVYAYCLSLGDKNSMSHINLSDPYAGAANNRMNFSAGSFDQGAIEMKLDDVVAQQKLPQPTHIKIDVDGYEKQVYSGGRKTIHNAKTALIEINNDHTHIVDDMLSNGFTLSGKHVRRNSPEHNYIFTKHESIDI